MRRIWYPFFHLDIALIFLYKTDADKSAEPPPLYLSRHPESMYNYQHLPKGVYLPEDDSPGAEKFTFTGCTGTAYLTFDIDYTTGKDPNWKRRRLTTELLCKCKQLLYQENANSDAIVPRDFTQIPLSLCIVSAQRKGKICDCELPQKLLPVIGQYSPNTHVEEIENISKDRLIVSESGQEPQHSGSSRSVLSTVLIIGATICLWLQVTNVRP